MNRVIVNYDGIDGEKDRMIDEVAVGLGLEPGDTGFDLAESRRDHSIALGDDRARAYRFAAEFRRALPWAEVYVWPEDDA